MKIQSIVLTTVARRGIFRQSENEEIFNNVTVLENHRKSFIQHCERSDLRLHFEWTKVNQQCPKLVENAKIQKFKCDILGDFQTLWIIKNITLLPEIPIILTQ